MCIETINLKCVDCGIGRNNLSASSWVFQFSRFIWLRRKTDEDDDDDDDGDWTTWRIAMRFQVHE